MKAIRNSSVIAARIEIGVCGHRDIIASPVLIDRIQAAIKIAIGEVPNLKITPLEITVLSPLAEGADRLVAKEILKIPNSRLTAVLPLEKNDYMLDFESVESREEFTELLGRSGEITTLSPKDSRIDAYEQGGRYTVDRCDILFALWDGEPASGRGGTGDMVQYARENGCPLVWIQISEEGGVIFEPGFGLSPAIFHDLDRYNTEQVKESAVNSRFDSEYNFFTDKAESSGLPPHMLDASFKYLLKHHIRADILASYYQRLHYGADSIVSLLALAAVMVAAFQILFLPEFPSMLFLEILLMIGVLVLVAISKYNKWHDRWMDYRYLAERLRSALFISITDFDLTTLNYSQRKRASSSPKDWLEAAFLSIWAHQPACNAKVPLMCDTASKFINEAWIDPQIRYHNKTSRRLHQMNHRLSVISYSMFALTICTALLHIANIHTHLIKTMLDFMAIVFPAIAASITAIRTQRDYLQNSLRSAEMAQHLTEIKDKIILAGDYHRYAEILKEIDQTMLSETENWRVVVRLHKPEVPV